MFFKSIVVKNVFEKLIKLVLISLKRALAVG